LNFAKITNFRLKAELRTLGFRTVSPVGGIWTFRTISPVGGISLIGYDNLHLNQFGSEPNGFILVRRLRLTLPERDGVRADVCQ